MARGTRALMKTTDLGKRGSFINSMTHDQTGMTNQFRMIECSMLIPKGKSSAVMLSVITKHLASTTEPDPSRLRSELVTLLHDGFLATSASVTISRWR